MRYEFLPPYSPDYNPIELAFSAIKSYIKRHGEMVRTVMTEMDNTSISLQLNEAVFSVSSDNAKGWFKACGY